MKKESYDGLIERRNKNGKAIGLQMRIVVGTKGNYIWLTKSVRYNPVLKQSQARSEARAALDHWANEERKEYARQVWAASNG